MRDVLFILGALIVIGLALVLIGPLVAVLVGLAFLLCFIVLSLPLLIAMSPFIIFCGVIYGLMKLLT